MTISPILRQWRESPETSLTTVDDQRQTALTIMRRALAGDSYASIGWDYGLSWGQVDDIVHRVCQHLNPDVYCEELKACLHRATAANAGFWDVRPTLAFLREHAAAFDCGDGP